MWRVGWLLMACVLVSAALSPQAVAAPQPVWTSCSPWIGDASRVPTAECGTVAVPVDYANPEGPQVQLAVIRVPASGPKIGMLIVNPGGPGASAVDTVAGMAAALAGSPSPAAFLTVPARSPEAGATIPLRFFYVAGGSDFLTSDCFYVLFDPIH